ncbi:hypothetical protein D3C81_10170 [compost metagenome]
MVSRENIKEFLLGGKCECVIKNLETENSFNYKLIVAKDDNFTFFVYVKVGKEHVYAGILKVLPNNRYKYIKGSKGSIDPQDTSIQALMFTLTRALVLPNQIVVLHLGTCSRCGRKLEDAESIARGMGPICLKKTRDILGG